MHVLKCSKYKTDFLVMSNLFSEQGNDWYWPSTGERPSLNYWANIPSEKNDSVNDCAYMNISKICSQTCITRSPLGQRKCCLLIQVTS